MYCFNNQNIILKVKNKICIIIFFKSFYSHFNSSMNSVCSIFQFVMITLLLFFELFGRFRKFSIFTTNFIYYVLDKRHSEFFFCRLGCSSHHFSVWSIYTRVWRLTNVLYFSVHHFNAVECTWSYCKWFLIVTNIWFTSIIPIKICFFLLI